MATLVAVLAGCSGREPAPDAIPTTTATLPPDLSPVVTLAGPQAVHEGVEAAWTGRVVDPEGRLAAVTVDFGSGDPVVVDPAPDGSFVFAHRYADDGLRTVTVTATDAAGNAGAASLAVQAIPRKAIFVGGVESESRCKGAIAPGWMRSLVEGTYLAGYTTFGPADVLSFSYSGRYCDGGTGANGADADYRVSDTCDGVASAAGHLRDVINAAAPSRVNLVGHSMGGLVATYLAGSDPGWAAEHIASIVAFDSPLQGVPRMNLEVLRLAGIDGGCAWNSASLTDLSDGGNEVLRVAARSSTAVPVYTVDATEKDGPFGGIRQAVPGGRTHLDGETAAFTVAMGHSASWWKEAGDADDRRSQRMALACGIAVLASSECVAEPW